MFTDQIKIFVNGKEYNSVTRLDNRRVEELSQDWQEETAIGKFVYQSNRVRRMRGRLDEYYIFPCSLSAGQIQQLKDKKCEESKLQCLQI